MHDAMVNQAMGHMVATYHYVRPLNSDGVTGLTPREFREQVRWIARNYRVVSAQEFDALHSTERSLGLITFDDAVKDQYTFAAPILDELKIPAVFFAPMRPFSDEPDGWCSQHLLHALAQNLGWTELEARVDLALLERGVRFVIDAKEMNRLYHYEVERKRPLKYTLAFAVTAQVAASILNDINRNVGLHHTDWFMTVDELASLQAAGHSLGGHGFDHVAYTTLDEAAQDRDMTLAQSWMTRLFGKRPRPIAFPFGRANDITYKLVARHGYTTAFTTANRVDAKDVGRLAGMQEAA